MALTEKYLKRSESENMTYITEGKARTKHTRTVLGEISNTCTTPYKPVPAQDKGTANKLQGKNAQSTTLSKPFNMLKIASTFEDIDSGLKGNVLYVSEYANDIFQYLRQLETKYPILENYLIGKKITANMRTILVDWLYEVCSYFHLVQESFHISVAILDRFLQVESFVDRENLQLVGLASLLIATKYEESEPIELSDMMFVSDSDFKGSQILDMEQRILESLSFELGRPAAITFTRRYSKVGMANPLEHSFCKYFIDLAHLEVGLCHVRPSVIAAAAMFIALCVSRSRVSVHFWTDTLVHYSSYRIEDFSDVIPVLVQVIKGQTNSKLHSIKHKYASSEYHCVSVLPVLLSDSSILKQLSEPPNS